MIWSGPCVKCNGFPLQGEWHLYNTFLVFLTNQSTTNHFYPYSHLWLYPMHYKCLIYLTASPFSITDYPWNQTQEEQEHTHTQRTQKSFEYTEVTTYFLFNAYTAIKVDTYIKEMLNNEVSICRSNLSESKYPRSDDFFYSWLCVIAETVHFPYMVIWSA